MLRTFAEHDVRFEEPLDGIWEFTTAPDRSDRKRLPDAYARKAHVPSAWETMPGLEGYRGKGWYRTTVTAVEGTALRLVFGGVSHTATVFVDGKRVGSHYDAFTPWDVVLPGLATGPHELVVEVDNTFGEHSALHLPNDYFTYGGITRPVAMQLLPVVYIDKVFAAPARRGRKWSLDVRVRLRNWSRDSARRQVIVEVAGATLDLGRITVRAGSTRELHAVLPGLDVEPWSLESPSLYFLDVSLFDGGQVVDDKVDRIGFREVSVRGKKLLLNGKSIRLRGYNRHEDHPQFGCALPLEAMARDLELLLDLGSNFVRTCHYPNDMRFLDLCDELGLAVWEESHARQVSFDHPCYEDQIRVNTEEMIEWHYNRPSILLWGCLNECDTVSKKGRRAHERVLKRLRAGDATRPVTYAANHRKRDTCLDLVDIVSWNFYIGWYGDAPETTAAFLRDMLRWKESDPKNGKGKPVLLSEFGAGAIYGHRRAHGHHWTEEYQARVLDENLKVYLNHPDVVGTAIWQFCDVRITEEGGFWRDRPRTMNNKGTVDEYRRPKLAYKVVRERMNEARARFGG